MRKKIKWILILIFLIILACRLYFVFQTPYFNDEGYLDYRLVQEISETGKPLFYDELSYDGRSLLYSPAYHYILAFFDIFLPLEFVLKVIPNFFISLLVFVVFNLVNVLVRNQNIALFAALLSGFVPILFVEILNNISVYSLVVPLVFYLLYLFIQIKEGKNATKFAILGFLLAILHPSAFLLLIALIFFTILIVSEGMMVDKSKKEIVAFFTFLVLFIEFLIYKKAFLIYGFNIVKGNVPVQVLDNFFTFNFLEIVLKVGILFIVLGLISIIWGWKKKREDVVLISSLILSSLMLLWFKVIELKVGLMFLGVALIIMSSISFKLFLKYLDKTKFVDYKRSIVFFSIILLLFSLLLPSFLGAKSNIKNETPSDYEILVLNWIKDNALPDVTVLAPLDKGHLINTIAGKRSVIDDNFLLSPDAEGRFNDVKIIYSTKSEVKALDIINKYNIDYILVPIEAELKFGKVKWLDDETCFKGIFFGTPKVYEVTCN